jgi:hypothetical protein
MAQDATTSASQFRVRIDTADFPISIRARGRVWFLRRWERSNLRRVASLLCKLPQRISATVRERPNCGNGWKLPRSPQGLPPYSFLLSCSEYTRQLRDTCPWTDDLEIQTSAEAFRAGAEWAHRTACRDSNSEP